MLDIYRGWSSWSVANLHLLVTFECIADLYYSSPDLDSSPDLSPFLLDLDLDLDLDLGSKDSDLDLDLDLEALPASPFSSPLYLQDR